MALPKETEEQAEKNRRALLEVGSAALPLLLQSRNEAVTAGVKAGASLDSIAGRVQTATRQSISQARAISRASGVARLKSEAAQFGQAIIADAGWLSTEVVRDIERAKTYSKTYAERWLKKANEAVDAKATTVAKAAKVANTETIGSLKRTAVTESSEAFSSGRAKYLRRSDALGLLRVWDAGLDSCPICKAADGTIVGAREPFPQGEPGSIHSWCKCSWTLLTSAADEQGTLIQPAPVRPVTVQVPGAASPFAPKGIVPSGGKLAASAETKALAKRLDVALGNVAKDGGASARSEVRALLGQHGIKARSLGKGANAIKVTDPADMGGMAGFHEWDGTLRLAPNTIRDSRAALRKIQLGLDPGDDHANALNVLLHEEIHGASAMSKTAFQGPGAALEEAATELAARRISSQLMGREIGANYADEIAGLKRAISGVSKTKPETLAKRLDAAVSSLKSSAPLAQTPAQHIDNFVDALKLTPAQRTKLTKALNETEWWKPGATVAKNSATKAKSVKAAKPKAVAKPRAPPKPKAVKRPKVDAEAAKAEKARLAAEAKAEKARISAEAKAAKAKAAAEAKAEKARLAAEKKAAAKKKATKPVKATKPTTKQPKPKVEKASVASEPESLAAPGRLKEFADAASSGDGERVRKLIRGHLQHTFPQSVSKDVARKLPGANTVKLERNSTAKATHGWDGTVYVNPSVVDDLKKLAERLEQGTLDDEIKAFVAMTPYERTVHIASGKDNPIGYFSSLNTFLHEEMHGFSRMISKSYSGAASVLEEASTELSSNHAVATFARDVGGTVGEYLKDYRGIHYAPEINAVTSVLREEIPGLTEDAAKSLIMQARARKISAKGKDLETPDQYVDAFVEGLEIDDPARRQRVDYKLRTITDRLAK